MIDDVFAVIADPTRRQILRELSRGERPVGDLVNEIKVSQPTVSKHLKVLRTAGLVETKAVGQKRFYSLVSVPLIEVSTWIESLNSTAEQAETSAESVDEFPRLQESPSIASASVNEPSATDAVETATFDMGQEGATFDANQPRHSSAAISFSPLKPFVPVSLETFSNDEKSPKESLTEEGLIETYQEQVSIEAPADEPEESTPGLVEQTDVLKELTIQELPALPSASEEPYGSQQDEQRGLFATLSRWGRRRSR